jgi:hypothetical protein
MKQQSAVNSGEERSESGHVEIGRGDVREVVR